MKFQQLKSLFSAGLLLSCSSWLSAEKVEKKPNVVFIITDQQFADAMSCRMGDQFIKTPNMDRMAAEGVVFTRAYSNNPISMPSRNSMFTGHYSHETGITRNTKKNDTTPEVYNDKLPNLGQYFKKTDYQTAYFGKSHLAYQITNVKESGFENVKESDNDSIVSNDAVNFIKSKPTKPFLMVASFTNPHNICEYAREISGRTQKYSCGEIGFPTQSDVLPPLPANFGKQTDEPDGLSELRTAYQTQTGLFPVSKFTATDWRKLRWGYYRMIEKVDAQIGLVLNALKEAELEENTLIVFTSDHGECAGAHGWNQKTVFFEESVRIPLILNFKNKISSAVSDKLVNTGIDILPTMLDFAGIKIPKNLPGLSLKPVASGQKIATWREYVVSENNLDQATGLVNGKIPTMEGRMVRTERYKYCIYSKGNLRESLADLQNDPGEMINLATDPKFHDVLLQHRAILLEFGKKYHDTQVPKLLENNVQPLAF